MSSVIDDIFQLLGRHIQNQAHTRGDRFQIPNVRARGDQFDVSHAFATPFFGNDFNAAMFAGDTLVADLFVFATVAFVIFDRTKNLLAEQTAHFRFLRTVVNGFGTSHFALAPRADFVWRGESDLDGGEVIDVEGTVFVAARLRLGHRLDLLDGFSHFRSSSEI